MPSRREEGSPERFGLSDVTPLLSALDAPSLETRKLALDTLAEMELSSAARLRVSERLGELLDSAWREADPDWTSSLFSAAARFQTPELMERLHDYAAALDEGQRRAAAYVLAELHDLRALDVLVADLDAGDPTLQRDAAACLVLLDVSNQVDTLLPKLDVVGDVEARFYLAFALARSDRGQVGRFFDVLQETGWGGDEVFARVSALSVRFGDDGPRHELEALLPRAAAAPGRDKGLTENGGGSEASVGAASPEETTAGTGLAEASTAGDAPAAAGERTINAWIGGDDSGGQTEPLETDVAYVLNFLVGVQKAAGLDIAGNVTVSDEDVGQGLDTEWVVMGRGVELGPVGDHAAVVAPGEGGMWTARFPLMIPKEGESEKRSLTLTPRADAERRLDVSIFVGRELYRSVAIDLPLSDAAASVGEATLVGDDFAHVPARHADLRTTHEWTTPGGQLVLTVLGGGRAHARGDIVQRNGGVRIAEVNEPVEWSGTPAKVAGLIKNVRESAERLRSSAEQYLDAIDAADLRQRLQDPPRQYSWSELVDTVDPAHEAAWEGVSRSSQLRDLALDGARLLGAFFPLGSAPRAWLDSLEPGWRLDISWLDTDPDWIPQVPWGLMYLGDPPADGSPVDAMNFVGLRFRIGYSSHRIAGGSKALGDLASTHRAHFLYWGDGERDVAGVEARWQEQQFASWANQHFVPPPTASDRKAAVVMALEAPAPSPVNVLYLFCHCSVGEGNDPVLRFGGSIQPGDVLRRTEIGAAQLADRPLVFANACTTSSADPYVANELQDGFFARGCRAYIGTETKVPIVLASRFASIFFHFLYRNVDPAPMAAGEAMAQSRLFLWSHYRNIGGLFYSYVNQYELFVADDDEVLGLRRNR